MNDVSVSLQIGICIWGFAMLLMAIGVCFANKKLWTDRMKEKCDEFQSQYDELVANLNKDKEAFEEEKKALAEKYKHFELENTARFFGIVLQSHTGNINFFFMFNFSFYIVFCTICYYFYFHYLAKLIIII